MTEMTNSSPLGLLHLGRMSLGPGRLRLRGLSKCLPDSPANQNTGEKKAGLQVRPRSEASLAAVSLFLMPLGKLRTRGGKTSYLAVLEHSGW